MSYLDWVKWEDLDSNTTITDRGIQAAIDRGVFFVVSMGNTGEVLPSVCLIAASSHLLTLQRLGTPADNSRAMTVGAVWADGTIAKFSSRGPTYDGRVKPEVVAPGVKIYVAVSGASYGLSNGTSYSGPYVAGVAALLKQAHPEWTNLQLREALLQTAMSANNSRPNLTYGWGLVQASAALNFSFGSCET